MTIDVVSLAELVVRAVLTVCWPAGTAERQDDVLGGLGGRAGGADSYPLSEEDRRATVALPAGQLVFRECLLRARENSRTAQQPFPAPRCFRGLWLSLISIGWRTT